MSAQTTYSSQATQHNDPRGVENGALLPVVAAATSPSVGCRLCLPGPRCDYWKAGERLLRRSWRGLRDRLPHVLRAVSARRDHGELGGAVGGKSRITRRHTLDDAGLGIALIHQFACLFGDRDSDTWVLVRDAGLVERLQKARVAPRIARISLCRRGHPEHGCEARKQDKESHGFILVQFVGNVLSNVNADDPRDVATGVAKRIRHLVCRYEFEMAAA